MFVDYLKTNFLRNPKGLYITTISDADDKEFNNTMSFIHDNFRLRDHTQKEMWLIGMEFTDGMKSEEWYWWTMDDTDQFFMSIISGLSTASRK